MTYILSDIHGCYKEYLELLKIIDFSGDDTMYILGDVVDRGEEPVKCLLDIIAAPNIHMILGNHEDMLLDALATGDFEHWFRNGGAVTLEQLLGCTGEQRGEILTYLTSLPYNYTITVGDRKFVLVHAGLYIPERNNKKASPSTAEVLSRQSEEDMLWIRDEFFKFRALSTSTVIFGHTPTAYFEKAKVKKWGIWYDKKFNDKICIDGGCVFGGRLNCLRLDDMEEFFVESFSK
jgi:serine/threonine protein phosphatase 1